MKQLIAHIRKSLQQKYETGEAQSLTRLLIVKLLGFNEIDYFIKPAVNLSDKRQTLMDDALQRLLQDEPIQYIIGETEFCGLTFKVNPSVLIPRPETAGMVQQAADENPTANTILDICTGSGCIAIALAHLLPHARVTAWDISPTALRTATLNNHLNNTSVQFEQRDILTEHQVEEPTFDLIVSNPPYVTESEKSSMTPSVLNWEPSLALFVPDNNPLLFYRAIAAQGIRLLKSGGRLYFEINRAFGDDVCQLLHTFDYCNIELRKDMYDNNRIVKAQKR